MKNTEVFFLDLQTTGAKPESGNILEVAFALTAGSVVSYLVQQPSQESIPRRIKLITGVSDNDMDKAIPLNDVLNELKSFIPQNSFCIIHYAQFERPFLESAFNNLNENLPFTIVCTHEIAKRLYPNLPSRGIKGLAGFFGHDSGEFKRSASHVEATRTIWKNLIEQLAAKNICSVSDLQEWLTQTPRPKKTKYEYPLPKEKRLALPDLPGIYRMLNQDKKVLYVGKATSLHSRVNSYFRGQKNRDSFKLEMLAQVYDIEVTVCETPLHAALLETDEIKRLNPYYNIALKEGERNLLFFSRNFDSVQYCQDEQHFLGPYSHAQNFESLMFLQEWLKEKFVSGELPPAEMFFETPEPQLIKEGFILFCQRHQFDPLEFQNFRRILGVGLNWYRLERNTQDEETDEVAEIVISEAETELEDVLTAEDIADKFERHFTRAGKSYYRSRLIARMVNADIELKLRSKKTIILSVRNGKITDTPEAAGLSDAWKDKPIETYDRLTVLLTELTKIKHKKCRFLSF